MKDYRLEVIKMAKKDIIYVTGLDHNPNLMENLDAFLWEACKMGWLYKYEREYIKKLEKEDRKK